MKFYKNFENQESSKFFVKAPLQNIIVQQNKLLSVLLSEETFNSKCGDLFSSNIFGEDLSEIINL